MNLVADDGFILVNDYGPTHDTGDDFEHQRFSLATFVGVNFPLLEAYFNHKQSCNVMRAPGDTRGILSRLFSKKASPETIGRFYECFGDGAYQHLQEPINQARATAKQGRIELAFSYYQEALKRQPRNWVLLNEVSQFLTVSMHDAKAGANLAKIALSLNPTCSADLWSTLGDALFDWGRTAEAKGAYEKALMVNAADVRSRYNLAWVEAVPYRIGPRKATANPLSALEPLVDVSAVQSYAREFTQENKGKWLQAERLGGFCLLIKQEVLQRIGPAVEKWTDLSLIRQRHFERKGETRGLQSCGVPGSVHPSLRHAHFCPYCSANRAGTDGKVTTSRAVGKWRRST